MNADTIFTAFSRAADSAGARTALATPAAAWRFQALHAEVLHLAGHLANKGQHGPIALLTSDPKDFLTAFFACAASGRPALVLDPSLPAATIPLITDRHGAMVLGSEERFAPPPADCRAPLPAVESEAEFYWGLTSGTTAEPKLFARSHRSWLESFAASEQVFAFPAGSRILVPGPLSHSLFLYGAIHALCRGHTVLAPGAFRPDRAVAAARDASHAYLVPSMLAEMLDCGLDDASLRCIFSGGAKLAAELRKRCEARLPKADLAEFYGASETSFITSHSTSAPAPAGSVGRAFPGVRIEIRDGGGNAVPPGVEGEIHASSAMLFSRYIDGASCDGWFTAGDLGFLDEGGHLYLTGRKNRIINSRALKIRPEPIERALLELPGVRRAAVIDLPDGKRGSIAVAAIEFESGETLARRTLSEHCRTRLGTRFCPHRYYRVDAMPLTRSGKIAFAALREALLTPSPAFDELR
jgi:long-chain acyl-CoA synthetase